MLSGMEDALGIYNREIIMADVTKLVGKLYSLEQENKILRAALNSACAFIENYAHHQFHPEKLHYAQSLESFRYNADIILAEVHTARHGYIA